MPLNLLDAEVRALLLDVLNGLLKIELGATFGTGTAWPSFFFDEISVTSP